MKHNFIMEKTPLGNIVMIYNNTRGTFDYYSDSNIPYRFLETVGRKYVLKFNCRPIFIDMEEELKLYELKLKEKEAKEEDTDLVFPEIEYRALRHAIRHFEDNLDVMEVQTPIEEIYVHYAIRFLGEDAWLH